MLILFFNRYRGLPKKLLQVLGIKSVEIDTNCFQCRVQWTQHVRSATVVSSLPDDHAVWSVLFALCNSKIIYSTLRGVNSLVAKLKKLTWNVLSLVLKVAARHCKSRLWSSFLGLLHICNAPDLLQDAGCVELLARHGSCQTQCLIITWEIKKQWENIVRVSN